MYWRSTVKLTALRELMAYVEGLGLAEVATYAEREPHATDADWAARVRFSAEFGTDGLILQALTVASAARRHAQRLRCPVELTRRFEAQVEDEALAIVRPAIQ